MTRAAKILSILFCAHLSSALNLSDDWRYAPNGNSIYDNGYVDQPYMLVLPDGRWFCAFTTAEGEEGSKGQHIVSMVSSDNGKTWSKPVQIEKPDAPSSSWATPFLTDYGRIYVFYDFNGSKVQIGFSQSQRSCQNSYDILLSERMVSIVYHIKLRINQL